MVLLIAGLVLFLGVHSIGLLASDWRETKLRQLGPARWKALYSVVSVAGLVLIILGYGEARMNPAWIWFPPVWTRHLAVLLTIPAFILLAAAYVPDSNIKARLGHPMLAAVKTWALAHLLANGSVADMLLFGGFLAWAIAGFAILRRRDRAANVTRSGTLRGDLFSVATGLLAWLVFVMFLHTWLIGVSPLP